MNSLKTSVFSSPDALNITGIVAVSLGSFFTVSICLSLAYYLFCKAYRIAYLFGEMENEVESKMMTSSSPLIL